MSDCGVHQYSHYKEGLYIMAGWTASPKISSIAITWAHTLRKTNSSQSQVQLPRSYWIRWLEFSPCNSSSKLWTLIRWSRSSAYCRALTSLLAVESIISPFLVVALVTIGCSCNQRDGVDRNVRFYTLWRYSKSRPLFVKRCKFVGGRCANKKHLGTIVPRCILPYCWKCSSPCMSHKWSFHPQTGPKNRRSCLYSRIDIAIAPWTRDHDSSHSLWKTRYLWETYCGTCPARC